MWMLRKKGGQKKKSLIFSKVKSTPKDFTEHWQAEMEIQLSVVGVVLSLIDLKVFQCHNFSICPVTSSLSKPKHLPTLISYQTPVPLSLRQCHNKEYHHLETWVNWLTTFVFAKFIAWKPFSCIKIADWAVMSPFIAVSVFVFVVFSFSTWLDTSFSTSALKL